MWKVLAIFLSNANYVNDSHKSPLSKLMSIIIFKGQLVSEFDSSYHGLEAPSNRQNPLLNILKKGTEFLI